MNMLNQTKIIITKPEEQSNNLFTKIKENNGTPILFPTIKIIDTPDQSTLMNFIKNLNSFDIIIFISPTAVHKTLPILQTYNQKIPEHIHIMAVGSGTATALHEQHIYQVHHPDQNYGSEGLLVMPILQNVRDKKIAIIKGIGGRELLTNTLLDRGAHIEEIATYQRSLPVYENKFFVSEWQKTGIDIIICTSEQSLANLLTLIGPEAKTWLLQQLLLVSSTRLLELAAYYGFIQQPLLAKNASDEALLSALMQWRGKHNG